MRCVVIGAGIIGVCTALRLAQQGAQVTLLEAGSPGDGTTGTSFAWVNASSKRPREYFALNVAGMMAHRRLVAEWPDARWLVPTGNLAWEDTPEGQERLVRRCEELREAGYSVALLSPRQVTSTLEPDLLIDPAVEVVAFYPDEGHLYPRLLLTHLLRAMNSLGVDIRSGARVSELETRGQRVSGVALVAGERIEADVVVCCCGRWTNDLLRLVNREVPLVAADRQGSEAVGLLVWSSGICADVRRVVHAPGINIRPDGYSRLFLHSEEVDPTVALSTPTSPPPHAAADVLARARKVVKHMERVHADSAVIGVRPIPEDGLSAVGWVPGIEGLYTIVTHSGITLGPALAEMASREIHGVTEKMLVPFRLERFLQKET